MSHLLAAAAGNPSLIEFFVTTGFPMLLIFAIFYFLLIRPANKKRREHEERLTALKKGDKVVTTGGLHGEVAKVEDQVAVLKLADNVKVRVSKQAISGLQGTPSEKGD